jgi:hypothetical protein
MRAWVCEDVQLHDGAMREKSEEERVYATGVGQRRVAPGNCLHVSASEKMVMKPTWTTEHQITGTPRWHGAGHSKGTRFHGHSNGASFHVTSHASGLEHQQGARSKDAISVSSPSKVLVPKLWEKGAFKHRLRLILKRYECKWIDHSSTRTKSLRFSEATRCKSKILNTKVVVLQAAHRARLLLLHQGRLEQCTMTTPHRCLSTMISPRVTPPQTMTPRMVAKGSSCL